MFYLWCVCAWHGSLSTVQLGFPATAAGRLWLGCAAGSSPRRVTPGGSAPQRDRRAVFRNLRPPAAVSAPKLVPSHAPSLCKPRKQPYANVVFVAVTWAHPPVSALACPVRREGTAACVCPLSCWRVTALATPRAGTRSAVALSLGCQSRQALRDELPDERRPAPRCHCAVVHTRRVHAGSVGNAAGFRLGRLAE